MKTIVTISLILAAHVGLSQGFRGNVTLSGNITAVTNHSVTLCWAAVSNAASYNIYRANVSGGPYKQIAVSVTSTTYTDTQVSHGQTLYYVTTSVAGTTESVFSNQAAVQIP